MISNQPDIQQYSDYLSPVSDWVEQAAADAWACTKYATKGATQLTNDTAEQFLVGAGTGAAGSSQVVLRSPAGRTAGGFATRAAEKVESTIATKLQIQHSKLIAGPAARMACAGVPLPARQGNTVCDANRGISWMKL